MSDAMNSAELSEQYVELLPARTVLSLLPAGLPGANGDPGTPGAKGTNMSSFNLLGMFGYGGSNSSYPYGGGDTGSSTHGSRG